MHSRWNFISTFTELHVHGDERWLMEVTSSTYFRCPTEVMSNTYFRGVSWKWICSWTRRMFAFPSQFPPNPVPQRLTPIRPIVLWWHSCLVWRREATRRSSKSTTEKRVGTVALLTPRPLERGLHRCYSWGRMELLPGGFDCPIRNVSLGHRGCALFPPCSRRDFESAVFTQKDESNGQEFILSPILICRNTYRAHEKRTLCKLALIKRFNGQR